MYISKIRIQNYRNFNDFEMNFQKGLNVIIGANNSGKTGLLYAINLLNSPSDVSVNEFNKNNLLKYKELYMETPPNIIIEYHIKHKINENDTSDESIIALLPFLGIDEFKENRNENGETVEYNITAKIRAVFSLELKYWDEYKKLVTSEVKDFGSYLMVLRQFIEKGYSWKYTNGISDTKVDQKLVTNIFDIKFIDAERTGDDVKKETRREINSFVKNNKNVMMFDSFKNNVETEIEKLLSPSIAKLASLFENENNEIGLKKGSVSISSAVNANINIVDTYTTEVKDTRYGYKLPLQNNGLGYNNLINIYMLIKLAELHQDNGFRILCLEEPEAHLHPAMQYKLFKYIRNLDDDNTLNQQIFVTTHSSNITAVAGLDNMFMMSYNHDENIADCKQQSLLQQFQPVDSTSRKSDAKTHLSKFLDVTRSDMLFADKVILVEGIAEKLLLPLFMEICGCPYEDEHISIVEIGGKHFKYFVELFNNNAVEKKVLCITDKDFNWIKENEESYYLCSFSDYDGYKAGHIEELEQDFNIDNFRVCTQSLGGKTFEDELFLSNVDDREVASTLFQKAISSTVSDYFDKYQFDLEKWILNINKIDKRSKKTIEKFLNAFKLRRDQSPEKYNDYQNLLFAEIFLHYAKAKKGDVALEILTDEKFVNKDGSSKLKVPKYIREGLEWLLK